MTEHGTKKSTQFSLEPFLIVVTAGQVLEQVACVLCRSLSWGQCSKNSCGSSASAVHGMHAWPYKLMQRHV